MNFAKVGAILFGLWGLLHIVGAGAILLALRGDAAAGHAFYQHADGDYTAAAGAILGYNSFAILWLGVLVVFVATRLNWRNDRAGFYANVALTGLSDLGLIMFLLIPGYVSAGGAAPGIALFLLATLFAMIGRRAHRADNAGVLDTC